MKKHEKYLLGIFGGCALLSAAFLRLYLRSWYGMQSLYSD
ncbi:hypothetical protein SAMN02910280_2358 [Ruminococcus flavefaciens]|uniref:Uncharacterized protein n=1 Tax=Ruminococcus flavefaciens TaxID=1265 RepID=A0A1K1NZA7_RUMFL|nr:hypothetical protein SAMN02910280_2358 [Ruminococcus flavefaciens]